jgi:hypothetical protein
MPAEFISREKDFRLIAAGEATKIKQPLGVDIHAA